MSSGFRRSRVAALRESSISFICRRLSRIFGFFQKHTPVPADLAPNAHILILKPCCLGDVVLTTPVIAALREAFPESQLDYAVSQWSMPILKNNSHLNNIVDTGVKGSSFSLKGYVSFLLKIRRANYDAIFVLDRSPLLNLLPWLAGAKIRAGIDSWGRGFALNVRANWQRDAVAKHEAELYLEVVRAFGLTPNKPRLQFFPSDKERRKAREFLSWQLGTNFANGNVAVIHPGGGNNPDTMVLSKRWPAVNFAQIACLLLEQNYSVLLVGSPERGDRELADAVLAAIPESVRPKIIDAVGKFDIGESGALFEQTDLFIGNDTGLMHLAAASRAAVVAVFGPSSPAVYSPYTPRGRAVAPLEAAGAAGMPISEYSSLSALHGGIETVTVAQVWEAITELQKQI